MKGRKRDYQAEYARRIKRGLEGGLSRSQARGHPRSREVFASKPGAAPAYNRRLELGFKVLQSGQSLTAAAKTIRVSPERLRHYLTDQRIAEKHRGKWVPLPDHGDREMLIYTQGEERTVRVSRSQASDIGSYLAAVNAFLKDNDTDPLSPFVDRGVTDVRGAYHPFETDPNALYRLTLTGGESFENVYRIIR
jgi:hypothetical protein